MKTDDRYVTVCDQCRRASCWHGKFMCEKAGGAGVIDVLASELDEENNEHPSHYSADEITRVYGWDRQGRRKR